MTDIMQDLARRAVASPHWRWMPGMLARYSDGGPWYRLSEADSYGIPNTCRPPDPRRAWPDLTDPATLGCVAELIREAWTFRATKCVGVYLRPAAYLTTPLVMVELYPSDRKVFPRYDETSNDTSLALGICEALELAQKIRTEAAP